MFTDEWGGGTTALPWHSTSSLGGTRSTTSSAGRLIFGSYYAPRSSTTRSLRQRHRRMIRSGPRHLRAGLDPGRRVVINFSDSANPVEIATTTVARSVRTGLVLGGLSSTSGKRHNVRLELARGFDVCALSKTEAMSETRSRVAPRSARAPRCRGPGQIKVASFALVRSYIDQLERSGDLTARRLTGQPAGRPRGAPERLCANLAAKDGPSSRAGSRTTFDDLQHAFATWRTPRGGEAARRAGDDALAARSARARFGLFRSRARARAVGRRR